MILHHSDPAAIDGNDPIATDCDSVGKDSYDFAARDSYDPLYRNDSSWWNGEEHGSIMEGSENQNV